ncbi:conjugative transposon protein TraM [Pedobacter sp. GR22-6]|uniref:conjugative transposon protein TraM n=1 Tax=Pedobacter sp. GR22-6 TaxID=3127957 RepID=UPI00307DED23
MKINFKQPKYIFPLIALPFLFLFFWVYTQSSSAEEPNLKTQEGMQDQIGSASSDVQKKAFDDKLQAYTDQYKEADGMTAVNPIDDAAEGPPGSGSSYDTFENSGLDSIDRRMKSRFSGTGLPYADGPSFAALGNRRMSAQDRQLAEAFSSLNRPQHPGYDSYPVYPKPLLSPDAAAPPVKEKDPMEIFKSQMAYMDSVAKASDPEYKEEMKRQADLAKAESLRKSQPKLAVVKEQEFSDVFNTLLPGKKESFITAVIDENVTAYAGSRIRLRLLEDIRAGNLQVRKGTYLYALISGFGDQRVTLTVQSILQDGKILPVKLDIYDADGLPGLYVPESAFREFTKDLGGNSMQGVNLQGSSTGNQFLMSGIDKVFQSTSSAIASMIRKNKAKVKYNSYIYLIDPEALQNAQKNY